MPWINDNQPTAVERVVAALCYLTLGLVGLLFIVLSGARSQSRFFRFHFLQSIIVGIIALLLGWAAKFFLAMSGGLLQMLAPALGRAAPQAAFWLDTAVMIILNAFNLLALYGLIWAALGKLAEIPFISDLVRRQM